MIQVTKSTPHGPVALRGGADAVAYVMEAVSAAEVAQELLSSLKVALIAEWGGLRPRPAQRGTYWEQALAAVVRAEARR